MGGYRGGMNIMTEYIYRENDIKIAFDSSEWECTRRKTVGEMEELRENILKNNASIEACGGSFVEVTLLFNRRYHTG